MASEMFRKNTASLILPVRSRTHADRDRVVTGWMADGRATVRVYALTTRWCCTIEPYPFGPIVR